MNPSDVFTVHVRQNRIGPCNGKYVGGITVFQSRQKAIEYIRDAFFTYLVLNYDENVADLIYKVDLTLRDFVVWPYMFYQSLDEMPKNAYIYELSASISQDKMSLGSEENGETF